MSSIKYYFAFSAAVVVLMALQVDAGNDRSIPNYLHICRESDPKLEECIKTSINILRPFLVKGIPELDIPSIEPLDIGDLLVSESTRSNGIHITAKDIKSYGSSNFNIKSLQVGKYGELYTFEVFFPNMYTEGTYDVSGQVLLLPIRGTGKFLGNFTDCTGNVRLQFGRKQTSRGDAVQIKKFQIRIKVGKGSVKLFNLFNGDKVLGDAVNSVINQNFEVVSKDIIPLVEKALQRKLRLIATKITQNFGYDQVFPL